MGKVVESLRMDPIAIRLEELLSVPVQKLDDCVGDAVEQKVLAMSEGEIVLLENLRFHKEEEENDEEFGKALARLGDIYLNDAFGAAHRSHASIVGIPKHLPSGIGLLMERELAALDRVRSHEEKPVVAIVGGTKIKTKLAFIDIMSVQADWVLLGNLLTAGMKKTTAAFKNPERVLGAIDAVTRDGNELDIGEETRKLFCEKIRTAKTVIWAGPLGYVEDESYAAGSIDVANAVLESGAFAVAGGGDLISFLSRHGFRERFGHASTGGGAMLDYIVDGSLVGLDALK